MSDRAEEPIPALADPFPGRVDGTGRRDGRGTATHYVLSGTGDCSYPAAPADGLYVALSLAEYDGAAACGRYVEVSGPDGSVPLK